jgi:hypothetical protein
MTVFKEKQLKGKLIFSYEEDECDIYVGMRTKLYRVFQIQI